MFARVSIENLQRLVVGGLGAALFALTCLTAAAGPATAISAVQIAALAHPADQLFA